VRSWFHSAVLTRPGLTFLVMGLSFFGFGIGSLNLFYILRANAGFLIENGLMGLADGGLRQLVELLATGYLSLASYAIFKACEHALVDWLCAPPPGDDPPAH